MRHAEVGDTELTFTIWGSLTAPKFKYTSVSVFCPHQKAAAVIIIYMHMCSCDDDFCNLYDFFQTLS